MSGITITGSVTVEPGVYIGELPPPPTLVLSLDAAGYSSGPWVDSVSSRSFTLNGGVTFDSGNGGSLVFDPASGQYAECTSSLSSLSTWTVEVWHYYDGTNTGSLPCIITETFVGGGINYTLGWPDSPPNLQAGFFDGSWRVNPTGYSLTSGNWYQIVGTYDGSTVKLYVNNTLVSQASYTGTPTSSGAGIRLMERWDSNDYWGGKLAIVKIYDGASSAADIASSWNSNKSRFGL